MQPVMGLLLNKMQSVMGLLLNQMKPVTGPTLHNQMPSVNESDQLFMSQTISLKKVILWLSKD